MIGYVMRDTSYVNRALYGTKRDNSGGFLRQLDLLFSPDGYYMEGAYYIRYALLPFFQFADAIERNQPSLRIYDCRGQILRRRSTRRCRRRIQTVSSSRSTMRRGR